MDHSEALQQMAAERYLMNELTPDAREAFEAHFFECTDCALDLRAGAVFVRETRSQLPGQLPELTGSSPASDSSRSSNSKVKREWWLGWLRPAFAAPAFATLLLVVGYQNLVTYPALRASADQPRLLSWAPLHGATRGGAPLAITADRRHGVALPIDLPSQPSMGAYASYSFELQDPKGRLVWTGLAAAPADNTGDDQRISLVIPGTMLQNGAYTITVSGVTDHGERTEIDKYVVDLHLSD
jgi:hypothetical protein